MNALLLAAGHGTRLRPFSFLRAKATLPLWNVPFLRFSLQFLSVNQVNEVTMNLHSHPDSVRKAAGSGYHGMKIHYSHEPEILGTAGAIKKAASYLGDEPFVVMNSDMLTQIPIHAVLEQHRQSGAWVTLVVMKGQRFAHYGGLLFDGNPLQLLGIAPEGSEKYHYTGLQIISPEVIPLIPPDRKTEIFMDIYPQLIAERKIHGFLYEGFWKEIGTLRDYLNTSMELRTNPLHSDFIPAGCEPGLQSPEAEIEPQSEVTDSIVMAGARILKGRRVQRSIIGWDVIVNKDLQSVAMARGFLPWYIR